MKEIEIFVEGTSDRIFLAQYLELVLGFQFVIGNKKGRERERTYHFNKTEVTGSISLLHDYKKVTGTVFQSRLTYNQKNDITTLLLMDADKRKDKEGHLGGFNKRLTWLQGVTNIGHCIPFLIPNNQDDGYLETILRNILQPSYQTVIACLEGQDNCLREAAKALPTGQSLLLKPNDKAEKNLMGYLKKIVKSENDYYNQTIWNLHHDYLNPLKEFLETHLT